MSLPLPPAIVSPPEPPWRRSLPSPPSIWSGAGPPSSASSPAAAAQRVVAEVAEHRVVAVAALERVVAGAAVDGVVAETAVDLVGAGVAEQLVVAAEAADHVVAAHAVDQIGSFGTTSGVRPRCRRRSSRPPRSERGSTRRLRRPARHGDASTQIPSFVRLDVPETPIIAAGYAQDLTVGRGSAPRGAMSALGPIGKKTGQPTHIPISTRPRRPLACGSMSGVQTPEPP